MPAANAELSQVEAELHRISCLYARAMDRNEPELLAGIMTEDIVIEAPTMRIEGLEQVRGTPAILRKMFLMTQHIVHNQTVEVRGDEAVGETYCTASHVLRPKSNETGHSALVWMVRYQDRFRRAADGGWRLSRRALIVDWSERRPVSVPPEA